jgi:hypothetical protein
MKKAAQYRRDADKCSQQAEIARSSLAKEYWLKIAEAWIKLAKSDDAIHP